MKRTLSELNSMVLYETTQEELIPWVHDHSGDPTRIVAETAGAVFRAMVRLLDRLPDTYELIAMRCETVYESPVFGDRGKALGVAVTATISTEKDPNERKT